MGGAVSAATNGWAGDPPYPSTGGGGTVVSQQSVDLYVAPDTFEMAVAELSMVVTDADMTFEISSDVNAEMADEANVEAVIDG